MRSFKTMTLTAVLALTALAPVTAQTARVIRLIGNDALTFSLPTITAKPGETLTVTLRTMSMQSPEQLAHNFVLLKPAAKVDTFIMNANLARKEGYLPAALKSQVIVATTLAGANEQVSATFKAPLRPGSYPYVCTFPGHYNGGMKGVLVVK